MDKVIEKDTSTKLTDEQVDAIATAMEEGKNESEGLKVVSELPSNNGVESAEIREEGYEEKINVTINPVNGVAAPCAPPEELEGDLGMDFDALVERAQQNLTETDQKVEITEEDVSDKLSKNIDMFEGLELSREDTIQILKIIQRIQNKEEFNIFKAFPAEIQDRLNKHLSMNGIGGYSPEANSMRNFLAETIMDEFIHKISVEKFTLDFQKEWNALQNKLNTDFSKIWMDYSVERENYIRSIMEHEEDETKKEAIGMILDAINEGFTLERVIAAAGRTRIKKYDLEKPDKVFNIIHNKYNDSTYNIYSVNVACMILARHMKDEYSVEDITKFFIVVCKVCMNYRPEVVVEHAFMYYVLYNSVLLDVYKGEEYEKFANEYKKNVRKVMDRIKEREEKAANENSKHKKGKK